MSDSLVLVEELGVVGEGDVEGVGEAGHVPGQLTGLPDEGLDHPVGRLHQRDARVTVQGTDHVLWK